MKKRIVISVVFVVGVFLLILFLYLKQQTALQQKTPLLVTQNSFRAISEEDKDVAKEKPEVVSLRTVELPKESTKNIEKKVENEITQEQAQTTDILSSSNIQMILGLHNKERGALGAQPLVWSPTLAFQAQAWADTLSKTCVPAHADVSTRKGKGENIWAGYGYGVWSVSEMVSDWMLEKQNYTYNTNTCAQGAMCGHYTQVVWSTTTEIGCGLSACVANGEDGKIFVCRYSPAGNIQNQKPY